MKKRFETNISFFVLSEETRDELLEKLEEESLFKGLTDNGEALVGSFYEQDDDDEWCVEAIIKIDANDKASAKKKLEEALSSIPFTWDYIYVREIRH